MISDENEVTIIGAGLVGSLLATVLGRLGYQVSVYEKRPDLRRTAIPAGRSINLALAERGMHGLRVAGVMEAVEPLLIPMRGRQLHLADGRLEFAPYGQHPWEVIYSVSRPGLNGVLLSAAEATGHVTIHFEQECTAVDLENYKIRLWDHRNGQETPRPFRWLLGADGAASILRHAIVEASGGTESMDLLDHGYKELSFPAGPNETFLVEKNALHIWPRGGFMLIALPNLGGSFTVTLFLPRQAHAGGEWSFDRLVDAKSIEMFFREQFPDARAMMPRLEEEFAENPLGELGTVRCWPWSYRDRALVMGDAAHAIVPFHGQGMNAGFEDCAVFADLLDQGPTDREQLSDQFAQLRKPNADAIAEMALENYIDMRDTSGQADFLVRKELEFELERRFPDHYIPRYSLVMFHRPPYTEALRRGRIQEEIIRELLTKKRSGEGIDWSAAGRAVHERLAPL